MTIYYLYVKTHNKTGLKYLGKTKKPKPEIYLGSGKDWIIHLKEHGNDVTTEILRECTTNKELSVWGRHYSTLWDVVNSPNWANIIPETGGGGGGKVGIPRTDKTKEKLSASLTGKKLSKEHVEKRTASQTGLKRNEEFCKRLSEIKTGKPLSESHCANISKSQLDTKRGPYKPRTKEHSDKISKANKGKKQSDAVVIAKSIAMKESWAKRKRLL